MSAHPGEKQASRKGKRPARERICETARDLFYQRGIRGVGVELIAAEAGTTKMSLYRNFASKDELVAEYLCEQDRAFWEWWDALMEPLKGQPEKQVEALFDAFRRGEISTLVVSKVANFSIDLPEASVAVQVSGTFGSRQEEAQRLGRLLRPKADGGGAIFYSVVSRDSLDAEYAAATDFGRPTKSGTTWPGKTTMSRRGRSGYAFINSVSIGPAHQRPVAGKALACLLYGAPLPAPQ